MKYVSFHLGAKVTAPPTKPPTPPGRYHLNNSVNLCKKTQYSRVVKLALGQLAISHNFLSSGLGGLAGFEDMLRLTAKLENANKQGLVSPLPTSAGEKNVTALYFLQSYIKSLVEILGGLTPLLYNVN